MAADIPATATTERSRRGLLLAGLGAAAAAVAASVARVAPTAAADGDSVTVGSDNTGDSTTSFTTDSTNALQGTSNSAHGVNGTSTSGQGVHGESMESAGVAGLSTSGAGMHGRSTSNRGVFGESTDATGVEGSGATGVQAKSTNGGYALHTTSGRVRFDGISGTAVIQAGDTQVTVKSPVDVNDNTIVLLGAQSDNGSRALWWSHNQDNDELFIRLSSSRSNNTKISYLIIEHSS